MVSLFVDGLSDWRYFFVICSIPGIACATLFTKYVVDPRHSTQSDDQDVVGFLAVFTSVRKSSFFQFVLVYNFMLMLLYNVLTTFVPIYYVSTRNISVAETSFLFVVSSITMILSGPLAGYLHDKFGFKTPLLFSTLMMGVIVFLMSAAPVGLLTMVVFAVWGVVGQMFGPIVGTLITRISPQHVQGLSLGLGNFIAFLGATLGPILFGFLIDFYGFDVLFTLTLIAYLVASLLPLCIEKNQHLPRKTHE